MQFRKIFFRFSFDLPTRLIKLQNPTNKAIIDTILLAKTDPTIVLTPNTYPDELKIPSYQVMLHNGIMKDSLLQVKQYLSDYQATISEVNTSQLKLHDQADYHEYKALLLLRECKMEEAFPEFKKSLEYFKQLSNEEYVLQRLDRVLESMTITMEYLSQTAEARECLRTGMQIFEEKCGKQSDLYIQYLCKLANTFLTVDHEEAVKLQKQALSILGPLNEQNHKTYLKTAIESIIVQFDHGLYKIINEGLKKFEFEPDLSLYYHIVMCHHFKEDPQRQEQHLWEAYSIYESQPKSSIMISMIIQKALELTNQGELSEVIIVEINENFKENEELQFLKCKLAFRIDQPKGYQYIEEFCETFKHLGDYVLELAQLIHENGYVEQAIRILHPYPQHKSFVDSWLSKNEQ